MAAVLYCLLYPLSMHVTLTANEQQMLVCLQHVGVFVSTTPSFLSSFPSHLFPPS